jgi:DNA primase
MSFTPQFLDELRNRLPVSDIAGRRVKLRKHGREHTGLCPFHNEKTPSFTVNDDKGFFHCFGCGAHGDVIGFVMQTEGLTFPEAVEKLAAMAGLEIPRSSPEERAREQRARSLHDANEAAAKWFEKQLRLPQGREALDYLHRRGLSEATIARFRLGYAPDARDGLKSALIADGFDEAMLLEAGLLVTPEDGRASYDRFRGRVIFPIGDRRGRVIAFGGRILGDGKPKYLNTSDTPLFHKGRTLYALDRARETLRSPPKTPGDDAAAAAPEVIVTEGYMDVIALHQAGFGGAVAPLGTALTEAQIEELWRLAPEPVLCFDGDEAGRRAAARVVERVLPILRPGHSLRFALLPAGEDPDSLIQGAGPEAMRRLVDRARPLIDWLWEIETADKPADTPERRTAIRKTLRDRAFQIAEKSVQAAYLDELDARFNKAFRPQRQARGRAGANRDAGGPGRRGFGEGGPRADGPRADGQVDVLRLRAWQALLAAPINHPRILTDIVEPLSALALPPGSELDGVRTVLLGLCTLDQVPEAAAAVAAAVEGAGLGAALARICARPVYMLHAFAAPAADDLAALHGWRRLAEVLSRQGVASEIAAAARQFAAEPTERNWAYLEALKRVGQADDDGLDDQPASATAPGAV